MRKILGIALLSCAFLYADTTEMENLSKAQKFYEQKDFNNSYLLLKDLNISPQEANEETLSKLNFYLGRSAFELGKFEEAYSAFERVLMMQPNHTRARLEYARTLYMLKMYEDAKMEFQKVRNSNIPEPIKQNIDLFLTQIDKATQRHALSQVLMFGIQYDSNVNSVYGEEYLLRTNIGNIPISSKEENDHFFEQLYMANHRYDFGTLGAYSWDTTYLLYAQQYDETHQKNIEFSSLTTGPTFAASKYSFSIPLSYERLRYASSTYLHAGSLGFKYTRFLNDTLLFNQAIGYKIKRNLVPGNEKNDSNTKDISLGFYKILTENSALNSTVSYAQERKDNSGIDVNVAKDKYALNLSYSYMFNALYKSTLSYLHEKSDYKEENALFSSKREDTIKNITVGLTRTLSKNASLNAKYTRANTNSNQEEYQYDKDIYGLNYMYQF
jgi:hypothetical protein